MENPPFGGFSIWVFTRISQAAASAHKANFPEIWASQFKALKTNQRTPSVIRNATLGTCQSASRTDLARSNQGIPNGTPNTPQNCNQHHDSPIPVHCDAAIVVCSGRASMDI
jgi:hypothetical protein